LEVVDACVRCACAVLQLSTTSQSCRMRVKASSWCM
jgi:hypothetical protein